MCRIFGYCRISTNKQSIERQIRNIKSKFQDAVIIEEIYTGKSKGIERPKFNKLIANVKSGDTIIFDSVSRMSRDSASGFELYKELFSKGVNLVFLKEPYINTETYRKELEKRIKLIADTGDNAADKLMNAIIAALNEYILDLAEKQINIAFEQSEKEVEDLRQRTREGIETARLNGKQIGRKNGGKNIIKKKAPILELIRKYSKSFEGALKDQEVIKIIEGNGFKICRDTYYKYKKELEAN